MTFWNFQINIYANSLKNIALCKQPRNHHIDIYVVPSAQSKNLTNTRHPRQRRVYYHIHICNKGSAFPLVSVHLCCLCMLVARSIHNIRISDSLYINLTKRCFVCTNNKIKLVSNVDFLSTYTSTLHHIDDTDARIMPNCF